MDGLDVVIKAISFTEGGSSEVPKTLCSTKTAQCCGAGIQRWTRLLYPIDKVTSTSSTRSADWCTGFRISAPTPPSYRSSDTFSLSATAAS
ncbi:hypothetical protein PILCRDRAFT_679986 [Piloderma croceum F 1598]|uniref:Uncharacterized protein n=1 Tax=Piloderma croceum (strain F 1598) TaxID=765440 RepID=A0A0C3AN03_PILCF|nr:hypothetical protein PILCRDRAFT_679986 [Piloderma croceum F 1598]